MKVEIEEYEFFDEKINCVKCGKLKFNLYVCKLIGDYNLIIKEENLCLECLAIRVFKND